MENLDTMRNGAPFHELKTGWSMLFVRLPEIPACRRAMSLILSVHFPAAVAQG